MSNRPSQNFYLNFTAGTLNFTLKIKPNFDIFQRNLDEALAHKKGQNQADSTQNQETLSSESTKQSKHPPGTYEYYIELGDKSQWANEVDQAISYYVEAIRANPKQHSTYFRIDEASLSIFRFKRPYFLF